MNPLGGVMKARWRVVLSVAVVVVLLATGRAPAQEQATEYRSVENPWQGEIAYSVGDTADPGVEIAGIRWFGVQVTPTSGTLPSGGQVKALVRLGFENTTGRTVNIVVVLIFEDEQGIGLDRVELKKIRVKAGQRKIAKEKIRVQADVLRATARLYLFAEVR